MFKKKITVNMYFSLKTMSEEKFNLNYLSILMLAGVKDYCQWESFNATCRENEIIVMKSARYGEFFPLNITVPVRDSDGLVA